MVFIDGTVVNVALPTLQAEFNATLADAQWVVESDALFLAALMLVSGSLGDRFGRRRIFAVGVALFAGASAWCGASPNLHQLIVARAVQGIGGALLTPGTLALINASFREKQRGRAIGTWSGFSAILTGLGPIDRECINNNEVFRENPFRRAGGLLSRRQRIKLSAGRPSPYFFAGYPRRRITRWKRLFRGFIHRVERTIHY